MDIKYFLKKMSWSKNELTDYLNRPEISHEIYGSEKKIWDFLKNIYIKFFKKN